MDGQKLSNKELKKEIYKAEQAIPYYKKAKTNRHIANSMAIPLVVSAIFMKETESGSPRYGKPKPAFILLAIASAGAGVYFIMNERKYMKKAVGIRNEMVVY